MRRSVLVSVPLVLGLALPASAQQAPPPIDVPTTPVPQGPTPPPPAPPPKAKPAPAPAPAPVGNSPSPAPEAPKEKGEPKEPAKYNNEGTFKVSGAPGSGVVGAGKQKVATAAAPGAAKGGKKAPSNVTIAQWPGFRMLDDGSSEVIIDFSRDPVTPTEHKAAGSITYDFKGAHVIKANNKNPLITVHFNSPVVSVRLAEAKGALHLVIDTRADVSTTTSVRAAEGTGGKQFVVRFPAGSFIPAGQEDADDPTPTQKLKSKGKKDKGANPSATPPPSGGAKPGPSE